MMTRTLGCVFFALVAVTYALPIVEDTWAPEDELLQRVFSDSTPMSFMQADADPSTIADAKAKKDAEEAKEQEAAADEKKFTDEEADLTKKAAALSANSKKLSDEATAANAAAASAAAANAADTMKKATQAAADTAKAEAEGKKFQAEMKDLEAALAKQDGDEAAKTKARIAKVQAELKKNAEDKAAAEKAKADAEKALEDAHDKLAADEKKTNDDYAATVKSNNDKLEADKKQLEEAKKKKDDEFDKMDLDNKAKAHVAEEEIKAEAAANKKAASEEEASIKAAFDAKAKAAAEKESAYQKVVAGKAAETKAHNAKFKKEHEAEEAKAEAEYAAAMGKVHAEDKVAADAEALAKKENAQAVADQKKADEAAANHDNYDEEMKECAPDGSECLDEKNVCQKLDDKKGPWFAKDLIHCSATEQKVSEYSGEAWTGADNTPAAVPRETASDACTAALAKDKGVAALDVKFSGKAFPAVALACGDNGGKTGDSAHGASDVYQARVASLKALADAMHICPEFCIDDTTTDTENDAGDKTTDNNGICIDKDFWPQFAQDVLDNPVYNGNLGTVKSKIAAGDPGPALCTAVTDAVKMFTTVADAGNTPAPAPAAF
jgi:hypothetical protein